MSYVRVIPRDLFNEANLLKCYGHLFIKLELLNVPDVTLDHNGDTFEVFQNTGDGSLFVANVSLLVRGEFCRLRRPLNSRDAWPLYLTTSAGEEIAVFDDDGEFTLEMKDLVSPVR